jgi:hypothetical protein
MEQVGLKFESNCETSQSFDWTALRDLFLIRISADRVDSWTGGASLCIFDHDGISRGSSRYFHKLCECARNLSILSQFRTWNLFSKCGRKSSETKSDPLPTAFCSLSPTHMTLIILFITFLYSNLESIQYVTVHKSQFMCLNVLEMVPSNSAYVQTL